MNTLVFYHRNCRDGLTGAWALSKVLVDPVFIPMDPDMPPWSGWTDEELRINYSEVTCFYVVDVACEPEQLARLPAPVVVLDHHPKQIEKLADTPFGLHVRPDMSGAGLAYMIAREDLMLDDPSEGIRCVCAYAQDKDLWVWKMPYSREVAAFVESKVRVTDAWEAFHDLDDIATLIVNDFDTVVAAGAAVSKSRTQRIEAAIRRAVPRTIANFNVCLVNCERDIRNYVAESLLKRSPELTVVTFSVEDNFEVWASARGPNARAVARIFGGEGHENAAGFKFTFEELAGIKGE